MAASMKSLEDWLSERLMVANPEVDLEIFVPYITGILDTDTSSEDKRQSLEEVLEQVVESGEKELCTEIISQWEARNADTDTDSSPSGEKLDMKLSSMIGHATVAVVKPRHLTEEEKARKKAIIAQYQDVSDGDGEDDPDPEPTKAAAKGASAGGASGGASGEDWMVRNMNSLSVLDAEREKREKSKLDHERKKEKDKLDREAQRQKQQDRKDNEKKRTQKGERRR